MASWPTTLPPPSTDYGLNPVDQAVRTEMDSGSSRTRRRTRARNDKVKVAWEMSDAQLKTFRDWFDDDAGAAGGAAWFNVNLLVGNSGFTAVEAKFSGPFTTQYVPHMRWNVAAELEVR